jgi:3-isopropylmalate dehydratase small subunit
MTPTTLFEKIWSAHEIADGLIYIDLHLVHEVTSPQAFEGLRLAGREVRRPDRTLATADHNVPTDGTPISAKIHDALSRRQVEALEANCDEFGIPLYSLGSDRQGIVHIIGPELGVTQPGMTIVCGDSHTATHGAFGALAFGIGTSEVEHVLATQTLAQPKPKSMRINYTGTLGHGVTAKDLILATIGQMGTNGAAGYAVEYAGEIIEHMSMEERMTICNMTIEGGGRAGMIAPDRTTFDWVETRPGAPEDFAEAVAYWKTLKTDEGATFDHEITVDASAVSPVITWGTNPGQVVPVAEAVPAPGGGHADAGAQARPRLHRLLHQRPHRRPARGRGDDQGPPGRLDGERDGRPRLPAGRQAGRERRPRRDLPRRGLRLAHGRLLDVPGHEPGHPRAGRALRVDLQPQLRRPPGPRRPHPPRVPADGGRRRDRGPLRRHPGVELVEAIEVIKGRVTSLKRADVDTDQIIPKQFLKRIERTGFGEFLFYDWAQEDGWSLPKNPILATGPNFGCGSSREHAPWALQDYGFKAIVASSFADIFFSNCTKVGLLPVVLPEADVQALMDAGEGEVDLDKLEVRFAGRAVPFEIDAERRHRLLNGLDDIALTLQKGSDIAAYESERERPGPVTLNL